MELHGSNALVVGMAKSGLAAAQLLLRKGARVSATDSKHADAPPFVEFHLQTPEVFLHRDIIVLSPGVPADLPELQAARASGVLVIGEVELAGWFLQGPVLGITGANGKTTTTALVGHILHSAGIASQVGGNIGTPLCAMVDSSRPDQWNVLELSSFQLETISQFHVSIGVALNVTPDHLDRHHTFEAYAAAKARIFENQTESDYAVLNADDATCLAYAAATKGRPVWFSSSNAVDPGVWAQDGKLWFDGVPFLAVRDIPLPGSHNVENVMAASAATRLAGATLQQIAAAVETFPGVEHRLEFVRSLHGVAYYNDSKATNVDAALKAVNAFAGGLWMILGGKDKDSDYRPLRAALEKKARRVLLIGAAAEKIESHLGPGIPSEHCGTLEAAIRRAHSEAASGDIVLLAPACASFDQFDNYEHRGRVFKQIVSALQ